MDLQMRRKRIGDDILRTALLSNPVNEGKGDLKRCFASKNNNTFPRDLHSTFHFRVDNGPGHAAVHSGGD